MDLLQFRKKNDTDLLICIFRGWECFSEAESASIRSASKFCFDLDGRKNFQLFQKIFFRSIQSWGHDFFGEISNRQGISLKYLSGRQRNWGGNAFSPPAVDQNGQNHMTWDWGSNVSRTHSGRFRLVFSMCRGIWHLVLVWYDFDWTI